MATTRAAPTSVVALRFDGAALWAIDQTELPWRERELELRTAETWPRRSGGSRSAALR